jgi:hypothetical protein
MQFNTTKFRKSEDRSNIAAKIQEEQRVILERQKTMQQNFWQQQVCGFFVFVFVCLFGGFFLFVLPKIEFIIFYFYALS